jgi:hypothetical protein
VVTVETVQGVGLPGRNRTPLFQNSGLPVVLQLGETAQFMLPTSGVDNWLARIEKGGFFNDVLRSRDGLCAKRRSVLCRVWELQICQ